MLRAIRENALCAFMASAGCATIAWLGLYGFAWNDYENEVQPAVQALTGGHVPEFLRLAPAYGGSLIERAPFALLPGLWGGGSLSVYRMLALPCLLAVAVLGVYLVTRMRVREHSTLARAVMLGVCVANPVTLRALELGHPEELLGGCLCIVAVLLAARPENSRAGALLTGVVLGLAIANKEWALLAAGPVLLALAPGRRLLCAVSTLVTSAAVLGPLLLASSGRFVASTHAIAATAPNVIFQPWQVWWFFGHHSTLVHGSFGATKPGYRIEPAWTGALSHPSILAVGLAVAATLWLRRGRLPIQDALLALTFVFLLRCLLDTWDVAYYPLPFLLALLAWEAHGKAAARRTPPLLALAASVLVWASFQWLTTRVSADMQAAVFLAWSLPLAAWLAVRLFRAPRPAPATTFELGRTQNPHEITVRALGRLVRAP